MNNKEKMDKKSRVLGTRIGTASHRLDREIMFWLAQKCGMAVCYRCGLPISTRKEFTVDHKIDWLNSNNPTGLFWDLDNISFSHHSCNAAAGAGGKISGDKKRKTKEEHRVSRKAYEMTPAFREYRRKYERARYASDPKYRQYYLDKGRGNQAELA